MSSIRELIQLQDIDTALATRRTQLTELQRRMEDTAYIDDLTEQRATLTGAIAATEREARDADAEVQSTRAHLATVDTKLYDGTVRNPKELMALQQDADMIRGQLGKQEEAALIVTSRLEQQRASMTAVVDQLTAATAEHEALVAELTQQKQVLDAEVAELDARRALVTGKVPAADLRIYTSMFTSRQGRAVAKVERTLCQGCRVNLPSVVVQRVRTSPNLVQCPSCGRILYT